MMTNLSSAFRFGAAVDNPFPALPDPPLSQRRTWRNRTKLIKRRIWTGEEVQAQAPASDKTSTALRGSLRYLKSTRPA